MGNKRLFLLLIGLILFIAIMGFSLGERRNLTWPERFVNDTVAYVQQWFYRPAGYFAGLFEDVRTMGQIYDENERLRTALAAYARDKNAYDRMKLENERLMERLDFTEAQKTKNDYEYIFAHVISASPDPYNRTIKLDVGSKQGITENMVVTTVDGLVGYISRVYPLSSTVTPITELNGQAPDVKSIPATVDGKESESYGFIETYNRETGQLLMTRIAENDPLEEGDIVITSELATVFPHGIVIGEVVSRQVGDFGLTHTAYIEPAAQLDKLTDVFVVKVPLSQTELAEELAEQEGEASGAEAPGQ
ncbi:rod shape-determining protein MreC [Paenibacillus sp. IB182496]|uniref:Cell shape-determining protein MreC n=1 Tax=Paenibacillus sabuli TaxID=2772509 RepID=A0A927BQ19_9BACL|nr:rod shape-determining protein MreC [Paenibacillus sabuli]MBD2844616.1 rod shape-determining protein MreC [Paenibacillus sabuli]